MWVVIIILVGAGSFYGGMKYGQSKNSSRQGQGQLGQFRRGGSGGGGQNGFRGGNGAGFAAGTVIAKDATSITIKMSDNSSKIIFISSSTPLRKSVEAPVGDLAVGSNVTITGSANSDGSITAQSIQLRDASSTPFGR